MKKFEHKILIVDDEPANLEALIAILETEYQVVIALNGEGALRQASSNPKPDLILLDVVMPDIDGYTVCHRLRSDPATARIPVIFITSMNAVDDEQRGLDLGAMDYIVKPFHLPIVRARVRNHLNLKVMADLLESKALHDGLTSLWNRRYFDEALDVEWRRGVRSQSALSVIMADIDFFKGYNDHYGHGCGDDCLRRVAAALSGSVERPPDLVARYGGEEFVALLPETDYAGAMKLAERFRANVEKLGIDHGYSEAAKVVTVSVGVATITPGPKEFLEDFLKRADENLYKAKGMGRNRVFGESFDHSAGQGRAS